jgi:hypothetical protein
MTSDEAFHDRTLLPPASVSYHYLSMAKKLHLLGKVHKAVCLTIQIKKTKMILIKTKRLPKELRPGRVM